MCSSRCAAPVCRDRFCVFRGLSAFLFCLLNLASPAFAQAPKPTVPIGSPSGTPASTNYSLDTKSNSVTFKFSCTRNPSTGGFTLASVASTPAPTLKVNHLDGSGHAPNWSLKAKLTFAIGGTTATYTTAKAAAPTTTASSGTTPGGTSYSIDLTDVESTLITQWNSVLPPNFDPVNTNTTWTLQKVTVIPVTFDPTTGTPTVGIETAVSGGPVTVSVTPALGDDLAPKTDAGKGGSGKAAGAPDAGAGANGAPATEKTPAPSPQG